MKLISLLTPDCTLCAVSATSKKKALEQLCSVASHYLSEVSQHDLLSSLMVREKMGSTGIGNGIAIPHGRLTETDKAVAVLMTTESPIPFDAIDNRDVDIFIALFVPEQSCQEHLSTLQDIAKLFSDKDVCKQVRRCQTNEELYALIQELG